MKPELYQQCFELLDKRGAIRKDLSPFECEIEFGYPPILSDVLSALYDEFERKDLDMDEEYVWDMAKMWDLNEPLLEYQSDEVAEYIISLLS